MMRYLTMILMIVAGLGLAGCGKKGDPERPGDPNAGAIKTGSGGATSESRY